MFMQATYMIKACTCTFLNSNLDVQHAPMRPFYISNIISHLRLKILFTFFIAFSFHFSFGQSCPSNIDFEKGSFDGWQCWAGTTSSVGGANSIDLYPSPPSYDQHTLIPRSSNIIDPFGRFPASCPNGSGYSVKLGNTRGGGEAEGISYEFTIPAGQNNYSLIYHYAVVFQAPNHHHSQQPRLELEVKNLTDNRVISCASLTFISVGSSLPGFEYGITDDTIPVLYKDWSAVSVDLAGHAGKRIRLFFKTADCTFNRHFGYAYIDVNSECSGDFVGATYCADDTAVNIVAPHGYSSYRWYDSSRTRVLGNEQVLHLSPPPPSGTKLAVSVVPYNGYGCEQTYVATLVDTLKVRPFAGADTLLCNGKSVQLGTLPVPGLVYSWQPVDGLSSSNIANPFASPSQNMSYILTAASSGGGCRTNDTVLVKISSISNQLTLAGREAFCLESNDSAVLSVYPEEYIQWMRNNVQVTGATDTRYRVRESGSYYAMLTNEDGCTINSNSITIDVDKTIPGMRYPEVQTLSNLPLKLQARTFGRQVQWLPATSLDNAALTTPVFQSNRERLYIVTITSKGGCITVDTQMVRIIKQIDIYVPTAFTPNNDGKNDYLRPTLLGIKQLRSFRIYNRWGQKLFETATALPGWNGNQISKPHPTGTVVWFLDALGVDGKNYHRKGTTVLIR